MKSAIALAALLVAAPALAQTPVSELAKPPVGAERFTIMSTAGKHGQSFRWVAADGTRWSRESLLLRGQVFETDSAVHFGADGVFDRVEVRGVTPNGDA